MKTIPQSVLKSPVEGVNLRRGTLQAQLGDELPLLVILCHFE